MDPIVQYVINSLKEKGLTLALAESMTCGMAAYRLSNCSGTSEVLKGAICCYTPEVKIKLLKVPEKIIDTYTCESIQVTVALAKKLRRLIKADVCAALTGLASPGGTETKDKPVGTVFLAVYYKNKLHRQKKLFRGTPVEIKKKACLALYDFIVSVL